MGHFSQLIEDVADQKNHTLSDVLMKAKVLASRLRSRKFRLWVDRELNGYPAEDDLPQYRIIDASLLGDYAGYFNSFMRNVPISTTHLGAQYRSLFEKSEMRNAVAFIEDLSRDDQSGCPEYWLNMETVEFLRKRGMRVGDMVLNGVRKQISIHSLVALLAGARSRLLDFLLELRDKYPELDDNELSNSNVSESEVDAVFERAVFKDCTIIKDSPMRDSFQSAQAGAIGPGAKAEDMNFVQSLRDGIGENSLADLADELEKLRLTLLSDSKTAEQDTNVAAIADAENAARKGDARNVLSSLKSAGKWAFDVATTIGATIAAKAIEKSLKM